LPCSERDVRLDTVVAWQPVLVDAIPPYHHHHHPSYHPVNPYCRISLHVLFSIHTCVKLGLRPKGRILINPWKGERVIELAGKKRK
jgi:hypothetical protein